MLSPDKFTPINIQRQAREKRRMARRGDPHVGAVDFAAAEPAACCVPSRGAIPGDASWKRVNRHLHGCVGRSHPQSRGPIDAIWSAALQRAATCTSNLPPGFGLPEKYPLIVWLHGFRAGRAFFPARCGPAARRCHRRPHAAAAHRGGSGRHLFPAHASYLSAGSFFVNFEGGPFRGNFVIQDVLGFVLENYPIPPGARGLMSSPASRWAADRVQPEHQAP